MLLEQQEHKILSDIQIIRNIPFDELVDSEKVMILLSVYSFLYLNGGNPGWCKKCMQDYYGKILTEGEKQLKLVMEIKKRTCIPSWDGVKYVRGAFYDSNTITDALALDAITRGYLSEKDFKEMPKILKDETIELIEDKKETRGRKSKK